MHSVENLKSSLQFGTVVGLFYVALAMEEVRCKCCTMSTFFKNLKSKKKGKYDHWPEHFWKSVVPKFSSGFYKLKIFSELVNRCSAPGVQYPPPLPTNM